MHVHDHAGAHGHLHEPNHEHVHAHGLQPSTLAWAMAVTLGLVGAEIAGGLLGHSVALLNDAVHNLSDVPTLGLS